VRRFSHNNFSVSVTCSGRVRKQNIHHLHTRRHLLPTFPFIAGVAIVARHCHYPPAFGGRRCADVDDGGVLLAAAATTAATEMILLIWTPPLILLGANRD
jgi:hypothetical protein